MCGGCYEVPLHRPGYPMVKCWPIRRVIQSCGIQDGVQVH